ncbi:IST1 homolog [Patella vulgata]|uniref:IST1 homolog n=1 Tax=Patella vulgata TaxID=6465 RepID=UPI0021805834|nr:IST1 homolog [Patella vulgata]
MFKSGCNYNKLKTNLRLTINRLKLLEKKKTELALKARKEIADYISGGKDDRARIRVEHIVREDYLVEAMELLEMYCDLLLARFGLIQTQKELDPGLEEAIASLIWATPRLQSDVQEFKPIADEFTAKYGKEFGQACRTNALNNVNEKVMHKMSVQAPPKTLIERYMVEIARTYNVPFEPDMSVMAQDEIFAAENMLIDLGDEKKNNHGGGGPSGGMGVMQPSSCCSAGASAPPPYGSPMSYPPTNKVPPPLPNNPPATSENVYHTLYQEPQAPNHVYNNAGQNQPAQPQAPAGFRPDMFPELLSDVPTWHL